MKTSFLALATILVFSGCAAWRTPSEKPVTVTTAPRIEANSDPALKDIVPGIVQITLMQDGQEYPLGITTKDDPLLQKIKPSKIYTFDLLREKNWSSATTGASYSNSVVRIHDGKKVIEDFSVCEVHRVPMRRKLVRIIYGMGGAPSNVPYTISMVKFPYAETAASGGCCVDGARQKTFIWVCPECLKAKKAWLAAHPQASRS